jgi:hypothetical protein
MMETLLKLAGLISQSTEAADPGKLRPALYLAQHFSQHPLYRYRLQLGKVVSDQLDQDLTQLLSGGLLMRVDSQAQGVVSHTVAVNPRKVAAWVSTEDKDLCKTLGGLLREETSVLDAAATLKFFEVERLGNPAEKLNWFRTLSDETRAKASDLSQQPETRVS